MRRVPFLLSFGLCFVISTAASAASYKSVRIDGIPHVRQKPDFCGEACAEMALRKLGRKLDQDAVFDHSGLDPLLGRGCYTRDLARALKAIGFEIGPVWYSVKVADADSALDEQFAELHGNLLNGVPSIICMHYDESSRTTEHFRLIVGYDTRSDEVLYHEPAVTTGAYKRMSRELLLKLWPLKYDEKEWTIVRMLLKPGRLVASSAAGFTDADFAQHIMTLKGKLPSEDFHIVIQKPFVVVGDESPETVRKRSENTVKWAVDHLKQDYFQKDPAAIIDVWLFKDEESYNTNAEKLFGEAPTTPYGYYTSRHQSLVMNISTGGGTLVHEIVHPFIAANFPGCPSWFNEGLASLYEQCGEADGHIRGETNWRLPGLQQAIKADRVPAFKTLMSTTTNEFYNKDPGTNYSQARYLCYYLQEKSLLQKYYHEFRKSADSDPTGYATLQKVLKHDDIEEFQKEWQAFVAKLRR